MSSCFSVVFLIISTFWHVDLQFLLIISSFRFSYYFLVANSFCNCVMFSLDLNIRFQYSTDYIDIYYCLYCNQIKQNIRNYLSFAVLSLILCSLILPVLQNLPLPAENNILFYSAFLECSVGDCQGNQTYNIIQLKCFPLLFFFMENICLLARMKF